MSCYHNGMRQYYVYIMNSISGTLYIGMTNDLVRRVSEHKEGTLGGFTKQYKCHRLAYYEITNDVKAAIAREKQLKGWTRSKKLTLISSMNPTWRDLSESF